MNNGLVMLNNYNRYITHDMRCVDPRTFNQHNQYIAEMIPRNMGFVEATKIYPYDDVTPSQYASNSQKYAPPNYPSYETITQSNHAGYATTTQPDYKSYSQTSQTQRPTGLIRNPPAAIALVLPPTQDEIKAIAAYIQSINNNQVITDDNLFGVLAQLKELLCTWYTKVGGY
jgi:hypothetical protein